MTNKLVIFDLDGVLMDSRDLHYHALNSALNACGEEEISYPDHLARYDGLSTRRKLVKLTEERGLSPEKYDEISALKQTMTLIDLYDYPENNKAIYVMEGLRQRGWNIAVASNAVRETVRTALHVMGLLHLVDFVMSNEDVKNHKPHPEMYWKCMIALDAHPKDTIIVEDSNVGRAGAIASGATLWPVKDSDSWSAEEFLEMIDLHDGYIKNRWTDKKMNVLIPMAGAGSRFQQAGYTFPKPLIEVHNKPMIQKVVENLNLDAHYIFIVQAEHYEKYNLKQVLELIAPGCDIVQVNGMTEGAACTTLLAKSLIDNDEPLVIANSDQIMEWDSSETMYAMSVGNIDGGIMTFKSTHPKWSYARLDDAGFVVEVAEKNPISDNATVGVYFWKHGSDYVKYAEQMIAKNIRTNGEFYVCPVFNEAIEDGKLIRPFFVEGMWGIGTPEDLHYYLENYGNSN